MSFHFFLDKILVIILSRQKETKKQKERWLSGRKRLIANPFKRDLRLRGFESLSFRKDLKIIKKTFFVY